jgi:LCP family protein required for cell wall assembly
VQPNTEPAVEIESFTHKAPAAPLPQAKAPLISVAVNEETLELDMRVPGAEQLLRKRPITIFSRWRFIRSPAFKTAATSLGVLLVVGGWLLGQAYLNLQRSFGNKATVVSLQKKVDPHLLKGEGDGRVNILLLGNGGRGHEAPDLTDTIMVASIDPVNNKVALVSIPRDLWISLPGHGSMKLNAAFETGKYDYLGKIDSSNANDKAIQAGFATADQAIEQVLGINIHYNALVNFISFKKAVDTIGGVTVDVPETLYDRSMAWENGWNPVLAKKGRQIFDGKHALIYVRSRHSSSDFARSNRQRAVLTAIKNKVVTLGTLSNPIKISQLLNTFGNNVKTDLSLQDAGRVYALTKGIADKSIKSIGLGDNNTLVTTGRVGNQSIVLPTAGLTDYSEIQTYIRQQLPDGYIVKEHAKVLVLNATTDPDFGKNEVTELATYGYQVAGGDGYGTTMAETQLIDLSHGTKKYTENYLQHHYAVKATSTLPGGVQAGDADFIIVLGNNETTR